MNFDERSEDEHEDEQETEDGEWNVEDYGPMTLEKLVEELRATYEQSDQFSPYLLAERLPNGWDVICKDGTKLEVRVAVVP